MIVCDCQIGVGHSIPTSPSLAPFFFCFLRSHKLCPLQQVSAPHLLTRFLYPNQSSTQSGKSLGLVRMQKKSK
jgi:hypothetical protein